MAEKATIPNHDGAQEPVPPAQWSERFLATLGARDEEIERPPQELITEGKDPFD
jgi:hypothetical protein